MPVPNKAADTPSFLAKVGRWMLVSVITLAFLLIVLRVHLSHRNTRFTAKLREVSTPAEATQTPAPAGSQTFRAAPEQTAPASTSETLAAAPPQHETFTRLADQLPAHLDFPENVEVFGVTDSPRPLLSAGMGGVYFSIDEDRKNPAQTQQLLFRQVQRALLGFDRFDQPGPSIGPPIIKRKTPPDEFHAWLDRAAAAVVREGITMGSYENFSQIRSGANYRCRILWCLVHYRAAREGDIELLSHLFRTSGEPSVYDQQVSIPEEFQSDWALRVMRMAITLAASSKHPATQRWAIDSLEALRMSPEEEKRKRTAAILRAIDLLTKQTIQDDIGLEGTDIRAHLLDGAPQRVFASWVKPAYDRELEAFALDLVEGVEDNNRIRQIKIAALCSTMAIKPPRLDWLEQLAEESDQRWNPPEVVQGKLILAFLHHKDSTAPLAQQWTEMQATLTPQEINEAAEFDFRLVPIPAGQVFVRPDKAPETMAPDTRTALFDENLRQPINHPADLDKYYLTPQERADLLRRFEQVPASVALVYTVDSRWNRTMRFTRWATWTNAPQPGLFDPALFTR